VPPRPQRTPTAAIEPGVIAAAIDLLTDQGPEGLTVRALARRAGVAPMSIYNHFGGKNGLLDAIWIEGFNLLAQFADTSDPDPARNLELGAEAYRRFALTYRAHYTVMFVHRFDGYTPSPAAMYVAAKGFELLASQVQACQDAGYFTSKNVPDLAQILWSAVHGYVSLELLGVNFASDRELVFTQFMTAMFQGLNA